MDVPSHDHHKLSRRHLLQWMGGLTALLTTPGCVRTPREYLIPYARMPEHLVPGHPIFYATAMPSHGYGIGLLAETHMGRPIKMEGNPDHPASLGATDAFAQASVLSLYDPERARNIANKNGVGTWGQFQKVVREALANPALQGEGSLRVAMPPESSPTVNAMIRQLQALYPHIIWHRLSTIPLNQEGSVVSRLSARALETSYDMSKVDVLVSFDCDVLTTGPGRLRYAREITQRRGEFRQQQDMNRIYSLHTTPSLLAAYADHTLPLSLIGLRSALIALAQALGLDIPGRPRLNEAEQRWITTVADDLKQNRGRSLVLLDPMRPVELHQLVLQINSLLGNMGQTLLWQESVLDQEGMRWASEAELAADLQSNKVKGLFLFGVNPVYHSAYASIFREQLPRLVFSAQLSHYRDETSAYCQWHVPQDHYLESWSDVRAYNGLVSIIQPTIAPLFASKSMLACLQALIPGSEASDYDLVRGYWEKQRGGTHFNQDWQSWLQTGVIPRTEAPRVDWVEPRWTAWSTFNLQQEYSRKPEPGFVQADLLLRPDPSIGDGSMANNPWLQELPKPFSKLTWDHALLMHPDLAGTLKLQTGDRVELRVGEATVFVPVLPLAFHPRETVSLSLGYGRHMPDHLCSDIGVNAYHLRKSADAWSFEKVLLRKTIEAPYQLARTQTHFLEYPHQHLVRIADWQVYLRHPEVFKTEHKQTEAMEPTIPIEPHKVLDKPKDPLQWGMSIDTSTCIGCNACVVACQAENNIPVVGKEEVLRSREMHWLRIDHYFEEAQPEAACTFQPVPCMHCETAPCEVVCPVAATQHSENGLNEMVYNRCVGTRYCSNNCPYKVRHFNYFDYVETNPLVNLQRNPDVTVRSRGVMEKCTYCVQRIHAATNQATREGRPLREVEVQTACAQACPTRAIVFGNINDESNRVVQWKRSPRNYELLGELNTKPRTTYLGHLKNLNTILRKLTGKSATESKEA
jgi:molybdopterin-containing oxidoreductase family iron-sulfur binding subunit